MLQKADLTKKFGDRGSIQQNRSSIKTLHTNLGLLLELKLSSIQTGQHTTRSFLRLLGGIKAKSQTDFTENKGYPIKMKCKQNSK